METENLNDLGRMEKNASIVGEHVVEHCIVTWEIKNFLYCDVKHLLIESPKFTLARDSTSWFLLFSPHFENDFVELYLHRDRMNGPKYVDVSYRFGLKDGTKEDYMKEVYVSDFEKGHFEVEDLEKASMHFDFKQKQITILCEIIVSMEMDTVAEEASPTSAFEMAFVTDFFNLYNTKFLSDITLRVADTDIDAHKAVISAKSSVLKKLVSESDECLTILGENMNEINDLLLYLYINNLSVWMKFCNLTLSFYDNVHKFDIEELVNLLAPSKILAVTECTTDSAEFTWRIENFNLIHLAHPTCSASVYYDLEIGLWCLKFYPRCAPQGDTIYLMIEPLVVVEDLVLSIKVHFLDEDLKICNLQKHVLVIETEEHCGFPLLHKEEFMNLNSKILRGNVLNVCLAIDISNYGTSEKLTIHRNEKRSSWTKCPDFQSLLDTGDCSDFKLVVGNREFPVHKSILAARSAYFETYFQNSAEDSLPIDDLSEKALECLLLYIYGGKLSNTLDTTLELLSVADKYCVTALRTQLNNFLMSTINENQVCDIALKAENYGVEDVKARAINYICENFEFIEVTEYWNNLVKENRKLATDILHIIADACKSVSPYTFNWVGEVQS